MERADRLTVDVCVIGGGPGGSTAAHRLATLGNSVCLVERDAAPAPRSGASLPPSILPLLDVIGARTSLERAGFLRPERIVVWWSEALPDVRPLPGLPGFHVDRNRFDDMLLQHAAATGVTVLRPAHAMRCQRLRSGGWQIPVLHAGVRKDIIASFVVDASGSRALLPGRRVRDSAPLLSLFARWRSVDCKDTAGRVEAGDSEWLWYAPLGEGVSIAAVFVDPKRLGGVSGAEIGSVYRDVLRRFRLFREDEAGRIEGAVTACDASSRHAEEPAGADFVRVGDAGMTLDPLSSQGIQNAVVSGLQAAVVINTLAKHSANARDAIDFFRERQDEKVSQYTAKTAAFYRERAAVCDHPFWRQRAEYTDAPVSPAFETRRLEATNRIRLSPLARIETMPTMLEDRVSSTPALRHAALHRPVAFIEGVELVPLLRRIDPGQTAHAIVQVWSQQVSTELGWKIMNWLWHRRIVVPFDAPGHAVTHQVAD